MKQADNATADSWYEATRGYPLAGERPEGDLRADVVVIGGGLTGAGAALTLAERGVDVALLEARHFGWGASGRSGGQIIAGYSCDQRVLERLVGADCARDLWDHSLAAVQFVHDRVARHRIRCDLRRGYLHVAVKPKQATELEQWAAHLERAYDFAVLSVLDRSRLRSLLDSPLYAGGVADPVSGHLHPLNYTLGLIDAAAAAGATLYQDAAVRRVSAGTGGSIVETALGRFHCDSVVYACNAYIDRLNPDLGRLIMPVGSHIVATEPLGERVARGLIAEDAAVSDASHLLDYYRLSADCRLLFGGRVSYAGLEPGRLTPALRERIVRVFPQLDGVGIDYAWGGYVAITRNRAPSIGSLPGNGWYAQGYAGQGMALAGYAGKLLADAVLGDHEAIACFGQIPHKAFPGGSVLRKPSLAAAMAYHRLLDRL